MARCTKCNLRYDVGSGAAAIADARTVSGEKAFQAGACFVPALVALACWNMLTWSSYLAGRSWIKPSAADTWLAASAVAATTAWLAQQHLRPLC